MTLELNLNFPDPRQVVVSLNNRATPAQDFSRPLTEAEQQEMRWYLETYAAHYTTEVDDKNAATIADKLPGWGQALFIAVLQSRQAERLFNEFQDAEEELRLLTISAEHPAVLSLPWELLRDPEGTFLCHEEPRISIRRCFTGSVLKVLLNYSN